MSDPVSHPVRSSPSAPVLQRRFYVRSTLGGALISVSLGIASTAYAVESQAKEVDPELAAVDSSSGAAEQSTSKPSKMTMSVATDQALVVRAPAGLKTLILGNPAIADVNAQKHGILVVTGKTYGVTNLVLVGDEGKILGEALIQVQAPKYGIVSVQRGMEKESYSCTPKCNPTVVLGDSQQYFSETSQQSTARAGWVSAGSTGR
jgi:hypothetical protein